MQAVTDEGAADRVAARRDGLVRQCFGAGRWGEVGIGAGSVELVPVKLPRSMFLFMKHSADAEVEKYILYMLC